jgi:hypothetical protein
MEKQPASRRPATARRDADRSDAEKAGPDSYRYRYREKPDADARAPIRLSSITRTVVLGSVAFGAILLYLVRDMGLDASQLIGYARAAVVFVGTFLVAGMLLGVLLVLLRALSGKRRSVSSVESASSRDAEQKPGRSPD